MLYMKFVGDLIMTNKGHIKLMVAVFLLVTSVRLSNCSPVKGTTFEDQDENGIMLDDFEMGGHNKSGNDNSSDIYPISTESMDGDMESSQINTDSTTVQYVDDVDWFWTEWFNSDNPAYGNGDLESPNFIADRLGISVCPKGTEIVDGDCRDAKTHEGPPFPLDNLLQPCGRYGLMCLNKDQLERNCTDFEVRFKCEAYDDSRRLPDGPRTTSYDFDVRIYIILAIIPVLIFVIRIFWTFTWDRQNHRFIRRDSATSRRQSQVSFNAELSLPPPSYGELFGENSPSYALSRNYKLCELCSTSRCSLYSNINSNNSQQTIPTRIHSGIDSEVNGVVTGSAPISDSRSTGNDPNEITRGSTVSSTVVTEVSGSSSNENENNEQLLQHTAGPVRNHVSPNESSGVTTRDSNSANVLISVTDTGDNRIVSNELLTLRINTNETLRENSDNSHSTEQHTLSESDHFVTSELCTCPCHKSNTREANYDNLAFVHDNETLTDMGRRMPGMHVPIFVTWTNELPPPSYKEALKILKKNKHVRC